MNIRKLTIADYDKVYALWLSCKGMGLNNLDDSRNGIERFLKRNPEYRRKGIAKALVNSALKVLRDLGINKTALVVFERNADGNAFWESIGFTSRDDLVYRNKALTEIIRIDT